MPFVEQSRVNPVVGDLLKVREFVAANGFSPGYFAGRRACGCFLNAKVAIYGYCAAMPWQLAVAAELVARYGEPPEQDDICQQDPPSYNAFGADWLRQHDVDTPTALSVIDAAIARVSA